MKQILFVLLLLSLLLSACSPTKIVGSSGEQPVPVVENIPPDPAAGYQPVDVETVEVVVGTGSPVPVAVVVTGTVPDTCAQVALGAVQQEGTTFRISLSTQPSTSEGCIQDTIWFKISIPLNIVPLPAGVYTVEVNGVSQTFTKDVGEGSDLVQMDTVMDLEDIQVDDLTVQVGVGSPIPIHAIVSGVLPTTCAQVREMQLRVKGATYFVRLISASPAEANCPRDGLPFRMEIPLNMISMPPGNLTVEVNGTGATFDPLSGVPVSDPVLDFENRLQAALLNKNAQELRALMGDSFIFAFWQGEGVTATPDEAVNQLLTNYLGAGSNLVYYGEQGIPGFDLQSMLAPDVTLARSILVKGWGAEGQAEALLLIASRPDGSLFWHSVVISQIGFVQNTGSAECGPVADVKPVDGRLSYNGISFNLNPDLAFAVAAQTCPEVPLRADQGPGEAHPPYTSFFFPTYNRQNIDYQPEIRVYEITGDMSSYTFPLNSLPDLQAALDGGIEPPDWFKAPLSERQKYLEFASGSGVRGLVQYMQDYFFFTNNGLVYEFNGLTADGKYFVNVRYPVTVAFLMDLENPISLPPVNLNPAAIPIPAWPGDFDQQRQVIEAYNSEALSRFAQMADSEAFPDLALLDALVESIQVSRPLEGKFDNLLDFRSVARGVD